jgi:hypothetical protein
MNITTSIAKQIGGEIESLINENTQIQFYTNMTTEQYHWRDSRFLESSDMWSNKSTNDRSGIIEVFKCHLDNVQKMSL